MADEEKIIVSVEYDTKEAQQSVDALSNSIENLEDQNRDLAQQQKNLQKELKKTDDELKKEGKTRANLKRELKANSQALEVNRQFLQKEKKERKDNIKLITAEKGSRDQLRQTITKLIKQRNALGTSTQEEIDKSEELRNQIDSLNEKLVDNSTVTEKNKLSVGGYKDAISEALGELGIFGTALNKAKSFQEKFNAVTSASGKAFKASSGGVSKASKALKIFKFALAATGIGLIVIAVAALVAVFTKTTGGVNKLTKVFDQISAVIDSIIGRFTRLGDAITKLFKGDFAGAAESAKAAFAGLGDEIKETIKEAGRLADLTVKFKNENREIEKQIAILEARRELERGIAEDDTTGFARRASFAAKEAKTIIELSDLKKKTAQNDLTLIEGEINALKKKNLAISDEQKDSLKDAQIALLAAESDKLLIQRDAEELRRKAVRDLFEFELDFLIDTQDKQNQISLERVKDEKLSFEERKAILEETTRLSEESFARQAAAVEEFTGIKVDFDSLAAESDAKTIFNRLKLLDLDDITLNRSREIIQERKILLNDFATLETELAEQKIVREAEAREQDLADIEEFADEQDALLDRELEQTIETIDKETEARQAGADADIAIEEDKQSKRQEILAAGLQAAGDLAAGFFALQNATRNAQEQKELEAAEGNEKKQEQIRKKFAKERKKSAIKEAIVNGALAITLILAQVPKFDFGISTGILVGAAAASTALQVATIRQQQFAQGGDVNLSSGGKSGVFKGASHSGGGIDLFTGSGVPVGNVQGDEGFHIVKKEATDYLSSLSSINQSFGGNPIGRSSGVKTFQEGGTADISSDDIVRQVIQQLPPIVVQVQDITTGISDVDEVKSVGVV